MWSIPTPQMTLKHVSFRQNGRRIVEQDWFGYHHPNRFATIRKRYTAILKTRVLEDTVLLQFKRLRSFRDCRQSNDFLRLG